MAIHGVLKSTPTYKNFFQYTEFYHKEITNEKALALLKDATSGSCLVRYSDSHKALFLNVKDGNHLKSLNLDNYLNKLDKNDRKALLDQLNYPDGRHFLRNLGEILKKIPDENFELDPDTVESMQGISYFVSSKPNAKELQSKENGILQTTKETSIKETPETTKKETPQFSQKKI